MLDAPTQATARPDTVTAPFQRTYNWLWALFHDQRLLMTKMTKEIVKSRSSRPPRRAKCSVDIKTLTTFIARVQLTDYMMMRDKAILLYLITSGRRPHNATVASTPLMHHIFPGKAILFQEFRAKNDGARVGNFNFVPAASVPALDPVATFIELFATEEFQALKADYITEHPLTPHDMIPLFLYRVTRGPQKGSVRQLSADAVSNIVARWFEKAGVARDPLGRLVHPKFIRSTQSSRMKIGQLPDVIRKLTCAWALTDVSDAYYFSDNGRPKGLTDFLLQITDDPGIHLGIPPTQALSLWITPESCAQGCVALPVISGSSSDEAHSLNSEQVKEFV
jgi:hypothetical protein